MPKRNPPKEHWNMNPLGRLVGRLFRGSGPGPSQDETNTSGLEVKKSAVGHLLAGVARTQLIGLGAAHWTGRTYDQLAREGYRKNAVAHRAVRIIAECAASVPLLLFRGDQRLSRHPLLDLLARPNPLQSGTELMESLYAFLEIAGNSYLEAAELASGRPGELYTLRPDRMRIVPGPNGWPIRYEYKVGGRAMGFPVDQATGKSSLMHIRTFHPQDDYYGMSPLEAAAFGIDIHNSSQNWNKALLDNAARPSGALVFEPQEGQPGSLSDEQFERLRSELEDQYQGARNAGRPFLLEGGLKWQQIAFSPQDMEFISSKHVAAREIALAFGVPPMILGIPGDNTYANYAEANRALWRLTLLPLLEKVAAALNAWLAPRFGPDLRLQPDREAIPALTFDRDALWKRVGTAGFLTLNEKRAALGFEPLEGGDELPRPSPTPFMPPGPGGGPGPFDFGAGTKQAHPLARKDDNKLETKGRTETLACLKRHRDIERDYVKRTTGDPDRSFRRVWRTSRDANTRAAHKLADGQVVDPGRPFSVGSEKLDFPCDANNGSPANTFNCRCWVQYQRIRFNKKTAAWEPDPVSNGKKAVLSDDQIANIVFNETASLAGPDENAGRMVLINAVINADERLGPQRLKTRDSASSNISRVLSSDELQTLRRIKDLLVPRVRRHRQFGTDSANGLEAFGFRDSNNIKGGVTGMMTLKRLKTQKPIAQYGPFTNSAPNKAQLLGPTDNYIILFKD
jgi:HK97 family phage portal protein